MSGSDDITEAEAIQEYNNCEVDMDEGELEEIEEKRERLFEDRVQRKRIEVNKAYQIAKQVQVGRTFSCAWCGKKVKKKSYQQKFCKGSHKDKFWNIQEHRWDRTKMIMMLK